jgi:hypothetical protein
MVKNDFRGVFFRTVSNEGYKKLCTKSIPNYSSFDFFNPKFDHSSYLKICVKYHFFCCDLLY